MKTFTILLFTVATLMVAGFSSKADTVVDIVVNSEDHEILETALTNAGLVNALQGEGPFTVFAPTDDAFAALLSELGLTSLDEIDSLTLVSVLQMHVLGSKVMSTDLTEGLKAETLEGDSLMFSVDDVATITDPNGRIINITSVDLEADNGVVHVIDTVILPDQRPETVVDIATSSDDFSILVAALTREDLTVDFVGTLSGEGPFTVFAPTDDAFAALLSELGVGSLAEIPVETLETVLQMHVLSGKVMSADLSEGLTAATLLGDSIKFSLDGGAKLMDPNGRVSNITAVDVEAQNGVVHVIDTVILPQQTATNIHEFETMRMRIYPNPASDYIYVESEAVSGMIRITSITGKVLLERKMENSVERLDLTRYNAGLYIISLQDEGEISTRKLIVR
ncbi:MAG: fasciclin domain-containing protein [Prolixibacteraceae bacterium]